MLTSSRPNLARAEHKKPFEWMLSFSKNSFECLNHCSACCRRTIGPALTEKDHQRIALHTSQYDFAERRDHPLFPYLLKARQGACIFLSNKGKCNIYPGRPLLCRLFPLQLHFQWDGTLRWCLEHCPGVGKTNGAVLGENYLKGLLMEVFEMEGEGFFHRLREYVLETKQFLTPLFKVTSGVVYSDWPTKIEMKKIVWEMFRTSELRELTPRGRLECILHELLPSLEEILLNKVVQLPGRRGYYIDQRILSRGKKEYQLILPVLSFESAARETIHLRDLEEKGNIVCGAEGGRTVRYSQKSSIIVHGFDGRKMEIEVHKLMRMLKMTPEAYLAEESYLKELQGREGRFGKESVDLTIHSEVFLMFLIADALELKANAFSIGKGKDMIGIEEVREAVWIVERNLAGFLEIVREAETSGAIHS
jgi:Fe-S-cluster containining protein